MRDIDPVFGNFYGFFRRFLVQRRMKNIRQNNIRNKLSGKPSNIIERKNSVGKESGLHNIVIVIRCDITEEEASPFPR